mgnify:CR=1 FL=1
MLSLELYNKIPPIKVYSSKYVVKAGDVEAHSIDAQIIPTIKDPQIDSAYINQFARFILPYIQQDYERELSQKDTTKESN